MTWVVWMGGKCSQSGGQIAVFILCLLWPKCRVNPASVVGRAVRRGLVQGKGRNEGWFRRYGHRALQWRGIGRVRLYLRGADCCHPEGNFSVGDKMVGALDDYGTLPTFRTVSSSSNSSNERQHGSGDDGSKACWCWFLAWQSQICGPAAGACGWQVPGRGCLAWWFWMGESERARERLRGAGRAARGGVMQQICKGTKDEQKWADGSCDGAIWVLLIPRPTVCLQAMHPSMALVMLDCRCIALHGHASSPLQRHACWSLHSGRPTALPALLVEARLPPICPEIEFTPPAGVHSAHCNRNSIRRATKVHTRTTAALRWFLQVGMPRSPPLAPRIPACSIALCVHSQVEHITRRTPSQAGRAAEDRPGQSLTSCSRVFCHIPRSAQDDSWMLVCTC